MIYLELFVGFLKVGCFSFGGAYGAIPLICDVVKSYGWLSDESLTHMIAISESTPGPIMVNLATYIGSEQGGILGALVATLAVVLPSFIIILLIIALLKNVLKNRYVQAVLQGLKPCVIGIVLAVGVYMVLKHCFGTVCDLCFNTREIIITTVLTVAVIGYKYIRKRKIPPVLLIVVGAVLGMGVYAI